MSETELTGGEAIVGLVMGILLITVGIYVPTPPESETYTENTYKLKINDNTVGEVPSDSIVHTYGSLSEEEKEIFLEVVGSDEETFVSGDPPTYVYRDSELNHAKKIANADYIRKDNQYYQVISQTSSHTYTRDYDILRTMSNILSLVLYGFGGIFLLGFLMYIGEQANPNKD